MPTIYAASTDGWVRNWVTGGPAWATVRDAGTGQAASSTQTRQNSAVRLQHNTDRGGSIVIYRSFFSFDTSSITAGVASATINIYGFSQSDSDIIGVRAMAPTLSSNLTTADFDAITGFTAGASMSGNVTDYTSEVTTWSTSGYNSITLNAAALTRMKNDNVFSICFVNYDYDYLNSDPGSSFGLVRAGMYYQNNSGTGADPYIDYTLATGGYGNAVLGVESGNLAAVTGVATANIDKVSGV